MVGHRACSPKCTTPATGNVLMKTPCIKSSKMVPITPLPTSFSTEAALRIIGHCSRHGGAIWGARVAQEYLPASDPLLQMLICRLSETERGLLNHGDCSAETLAAYCRTRFRAIPSAEHCTSPARNRPSWSIRKHSLKNLVRIRRRTAVARPSRLSTLLRDQAQFSIQESAHKFD